jgi:predicted DsbA family dithiol-disulfide isomerase
MGTASSKLDLTLAPSVRAQHAALDAARRNGAAAGGIGAPMADSVPSPSAELRIDFVSDVVCPWCFIGLRRLEQAMERLRVPAEAVVFHPFELDPSVPPEGVDLREHLRSKHQAAPERLFGHVVAAAKESGIDLDFAKVERRPSTLKAHALIAAAQSAGLPAGAPHALVRSIFEAYFLEGKDVGDAAFLSELGVRHGLAREAIAALLADAGVLAETRRTAGELAAQGIGGVPFVVIQDKVAISGAQPTETFVQAIERARAPS